MTDPLEVAVSVFTEFDLPEVLNDDLIADLIAYTLTSEDAEGLWEVNVAFVGEDEITELHKQFMQIEEPTDILTFPFDDPEQPGGDIAICVPVAADQAIDHELTLERELCFLVVHGVLHLLEHDDRTDEMRGAMLSRQDQILDTWGRVSR